MKNMDKPVLEILISSYLPRHLKPEVQTYIDQKQRRVISLQAFGRVMVLVQTDHPATLLWLQKGGEKLMENAMSKAESELYSEIKGLILLKCTGLKCMKKIGQT